MNRFMYGLLFVLIPVFVPAQQSGVWTTVKTPAELVGAWEGAVNIPIPENEDAGLPDSSIEVEFSLEYFKGGEELNCVMKVNMKRYVTDWAAGPNAQAQKLTRDDFWDILTKEFDGSGLVVGGKYFVLMNLADTADNFISSDAGLTIVKNPEKNALKLIFGETISFGLGDEGFTEVVLDKKQR
jgi:hypothetical protein